MPFYRSKRVIVYFYASFKNIIMKKLLNKKLVILASVVVLGCCFFSFKGDNRNFQIAKNLDIFNAVFKELDMFYVDTINPDKTVRAGIDAMLMQLDPYTNYFPEEEMGDLEYMTTGKYGGIGSIISYYKPKDRVVINEPYPDMPAAKVGLKAGDVLMEIDGKDLKGKTVSDVSDMLKGEIGTSFVLKVERPGEKKPLDFKITRQSIQINPVPYYGIVGKNTGYIVLTSFTDKASQEVRKAFVSLKKQGVTSLILDLRNNGGGLLSEAVDIVNLFVPKGQEVVSTRGKMKQWDRTYKTSHEPLDTEIPLGILVNSSSASASEIVTGALQDLDRAIVVGTRTFGKGLVQTTRDLPYNGSLKVTTSKYYIPSGRCIQAIDYKHRNEDGSVGRIPDSLTTVFHTAAGREVRDGGGVSPDKEVEAEKLPTLLFYLVNENLVFDYATDYCLKHPVIAPVEQFEITDTDYKEFKEKVKKADFKYDQQSEKALKQLKEIAEFEGYMDDASEEFKALEKKLNHNLDRDLDYFSKNIKQLLAMEIVKRYYYQPGVVKMQLKDDDDLKEALKVLGDLPEYKKVLTGK